MARLAHAALALLLPLTLLAPALASAQDEAAPPAEYDPLVDAAVTEFSAGRWAEARALFSRAHDVFPNARTQRGVGMSAFEMRDYPAAVVALSAALTDARRALTDEQRAQVSALLLRARAFVGRFVVPVAPAGAHLYVDGAHVALAGWPAAEGELLLGVGEHQIAIRDDAGHATTARVVVRGSEDLPLEIDLAPLSPPPEITYVPDPPPSHTAPRDAEEAAPALDPAPWILAASAGGVALVGAVLLGVGYADFGTVQGAPMGTEWSTVASAHDRAPILIGVGGTMLGVGLGIAAIGIGWGIASLSSGGSSRDRALHQLRLVAGAGSLGLTGSF